MKKKEIIISILFTILISLLMYFLSSKKSEDLIPVDVYEVFVEGKSIGYLSNEEEFLKGYLHDININDVSEVESLVENSLQ